jgi:hypothetical protein
LGWGDCPGNPSSRLTLQNSLSSLAYNAFRYAAALAFVAISMYVMTESSLPSMIETFSKLTLLKSGLIYVCSGELSNISCKAGAESGLMMSRSERELVSHDAETM